MSLYSIVRRTYTQGHYTIAEMRAAVRRHGPPHTAYLTEPLLPHVWVKCMASNRLTPQIGFLQPLLPHLVNQSSHLCMLAIHTKSRTEMGCHFYRRYAVVTLIKRMALHGKHSGTSFLIFSSVGHSIEMCDAAHSQNTVRDLFSCV